MHKYSKPLKYFGILILTFWIIKWSLLHINFNPKYKVGQAIDALNGVTVYYNGGIGNVEGRNTTADGYNLGLKYQCVEFVKRYYYTHYQHKMPDPYGHAKQFFDKTLSDSTKNTKRDLMQYTNPSKSQPKEGDLVIYDGSFMNEYGHVSIVSKVSDNQVEIIQQNAGAFGSSRETFILEKNQNTYCIKNDRILGWLRKE